MNCKICPHCKTYSDANNIRCNTCGRELPNIVYYEEVMKKEYKDTQKYINRKLNPQSYFSDFKKLLQEEYGIRRSDEKQNIAFNLTMEHLIYQTPLDSSIEKRYIESAINLNKLKDMPENQFKQLVYNDAKEMFFNILNNREIVFNIYKHIPEQTIPTTVVKNKHGTGTKIVATRLFGVFGLAGTNGVEQQTVNKVIPAHDELARNVNINANDNNMSIQIINIDEGKLPRDTYTWNQINEMDSDNYLKSDKFEAILLNDFKAQEIIQSIENIYFKFLNQDHPLRQIIDHAEIKGMLIKDFREYINEHAYGNSAPANNDSGAKELEEYYELKEKGIITESEYLNKKNEILGIDNNNNQEPIIANRNFCPNCGTKIIDKNNKFCTECGYKLI